MDSETEEAIQRIIRSKFQSQTVICITHKLDSILDFDRVVMMDKGRVVEFDSPSALLARDSAFKRLFESTRGVPEQ